MVTGPNGAQRLIVLWGVPGAGKSRFASHLVDDHGFIFIDTDVGAATDLLRMSWFSLISHGPVGPFLRQVAVQPTPVVAEYGLWANAQNIALLQQLETQGAEPWWFDGDRDACFAGWQAENERRGRLLQDQRWWDVVSEIDRNMTALEALYGPDRMLTTVDIGPTYRDVHELDQIIVVDP